MSKIVVIDWGPRQISVLQAECRGGCTAVQRIATWELTAGNEPTPPAAFTQFLRDVLTDRSSPVARVVGLVGRHQVVLRNLSVPSAAVSELASIVRFQAMRELSFPADQSVIDFEPLLAAGHEGSQRVTLAAMQRETVVRCQGAVASSSGELRRLGLRPWATWRAYRQLATTPGEAVLLVHQVGDYLELTVGHGDHMVFSHAAFLSGPTSDHGSESRIVAGIAGEVRRILAAFASQSAGIAIQRIALPAGPNEHQELVDALAAQCGLPVQRFDPFQAAQLSPEVRKNLQELRDVRTTYAAVLGAALAGDEDWPIDFVNPKRPVARRKLGRPLAALAAVAATLLLAGGYWLASQQLTRVQTQIKLQAGQLEKLNKSLGVADELSREYEALAEWTQLDTNCLDELRRLSAEYVDARKIFLGALTVTHDASSAESPRIMLEGAARSELLIAEFHTKLNRNGHYSAQLIGAVQADGRGGDYRYGFKTSLTVRPSPADADSQSSRE